METTFLPNEMKPHTAPTLREEIANSITHGIGAALSIAGLTLLVVLASIYGTALHVISFSIYGATLVILYLASTLYHSIRSVRLKRIFQKIDHAAIYLLIAGTYTPFMLVNMRGAWGYSLLILVWAMALVGVGLKTRQFHKYRKVSTLGYIFMGWLSIVGLDQMMATIPTGGLVWLFAGGILYTSGVIFYVWHKLPYNHAIWHVFVLGGSICHFFAILFYVLPAS